MLVIQRFHQEKLLSGLKLMPEPRVFNLSLHLHYNRECSSLVS